MPRGKPEGLTLGFIGSGEADPDSITVLLNDLLEANGGALKFIIPITRTHFTDSIAAVMEYATANDVPYEAVHDADAKTARALKTPLANASKAHSITQITNKVVSLLKTSDNPQLLVLWNEDDDEMLKTVEKAFEAEIPVYDLSDGLTKLEPAEPGGPTEPEEPAESGGVDQDENEFQPYTQEELEGMEIDDLKAICEGNDIDVPPRSRKPTYITAILEAQEADAEAELPPDPDAEAEREAAERAAEEGEPGELAGDLDALIEALDGLFDDKLNGLVEALAGEADADNPEPGPLAEIISRMDDLDTKLTEVRTVTDNLMVKVLEFTKPRESPGESTGRALQARKAATATQTTEEGSAPARRVLGRPRKDGSPPQPRERDEAGNVVKKAPPTGGRPRKDGTMAKPAGAAQSNVRSIRRNPSRG